MSNQRNKYKKLSGIYTKLSLRIYISRRVFAQRKIPLEFCKLDPFYRMLNSIFNFGIWLLRIRPSGNIAL